MPKERDVRFVLGVQPAREAIAVHGAKLRVLIEGRDLRSRHAPGEGEPVLEAVARYARDRGAEVERVDRGTLDRIAQGERHQGVIVEAPPLAILDESIIIEATGDRPPLIVALDELTDPHNFGAIVRSAVAFGATGIVWSEDRSAPLSPAMTRASAGAVEHARLCRVTNLARTLGTFVDAAMQVVGLDTSATDMLHELPLGLPTCLVVGSEGKGLRKATKRACSRLAKLPMHGPIASLNASVAAAIALYEVVRQRQGVGTVEPR